MSDGSNHSNGDFTERAAEFWRRRGGRPTYVRKLICEHVARQKSPFTADHLWSEASRSDSGISIASVYRTLADLV